MFPRAQWWVIQMGTLSYFRKSPGVHCTLRIRPLVIPPLQLLQGFPLPHQPYCLTPCAMSLNLTQLYYVSCRKWEEDAFPAWSWLWCP